jgi:hypothetical protein
MAPMNPRLLRPTSSTLDKDAAVYLNAVAAADQQQLEPAVRKAINDFVVGCKRDGIWDALKASCILMGARTLSGALVPLKGAAPTNNNFVSGDYNRKTGLVGDGSTKYLDSNRNNNADPQNNQHLAAYVDTATTVDFGAVIGVGTGLLNGASLIQDQLTSIVLRSRNVAAEILARPTALTGFVGLSRENSATYIARAYAANSTQTRASQTALNANVFVFARNDTTTPAITFNNARLAFYSVGESLDLALLDTRVTALYTAIGAAI